MVTVAEASAIVMAHTFRPGTQHVGIDDAVGRVLAEAIAADRDLPPLDRVTMDGIAISFESWSSGRVSFAIEGVQAAGMPQATLGHSDRCMEVMTGAPLPIGTDTVIPYEEVSVNDGQAEITAGKVVRGQRIHLAGSDARSGALLLQPGTRISPAEVALLATVGKRTVNVFEFPSTAVVSSGDELVGVGDMPSAHQVRRSNTHAILAAMKTMGWPATAFHLPDHQESIREQMKNILADHDILILSGGVSKGKFDFIPDALEANGIVRHFHHVKQRPGKPFWFGMSADGRKTVFALPGNPVSTYLCFFRYVRPWMLKAHQTGDALKYAVLTEGYKVPEGLTYFLQVDVRNERGILNAYPCAGGGSGDLANLKDVSGFLEISVAQGIAQKGEIFPYYPFRS